MTQATIYPARQIHTVDESRPRASALAVAEGRVLAVGELDLLEAHFGGARVDRAFADKVIVPGFVEAHCHSMEGAFWLFPYVGYFDRQDPEGRLWSGCRSIDEVLDRLSELERDLSDPEEALIVWGLDPIYFPGERLTARHLDRISAKRPIFVFHASGHIATVNTGLMQREGIGPDTLMEGVAKDADGQPNGELQEPPAMALAGAAVATLFKALESEVALHNFGNMAARAGCTTVTDLGTARLAHEPALAMWERVVETPEFPVRASVFYSPHRGGPPQPAEAAELARRLGDRSGDKLRLGHVKLLLDGSIQGYTARLRWPGYHGGQPNGIWLQPPEQFESVLEAYHEAGLTVHVHCNGDEATDVFLDAVEAVLQRHPRRDHRHTVQHCQMATPDQYRRMATLGMCANLFSNHVYYWGDQHCALTVGPSRAARMNAAATAAREGIRFALHSDASVTPIGQLHTMWCAVNRRTATGKVLGEGECIPAERALRAVTLDAAYQLKMDREIGSIEVGKRADFALLEEDPLTVAPEKIKDVPVWGTVLGGQVQPAAALRD